MAQVTGELVEVGTSDALFDPVHSAVAVKHGRKTIARTTVDADHRFTLEVPDEVTGELELVTSIVGAAPVLFQAGSDVDLVVYVGRGGSNFLV